MAFTDLGSFLKAEFLKMDDMFVVVQVERTTSYNQFVQILDELDRNGIDTIGLKRMSDHGSPFGMVIGVGFSRRPGPSSAGLKTFY
jgi:hypothetical protein